MPRQYYRSRLDKRSEELRVIPCLGEDLDSVVARLLTSCFVLMQQFNPKLILVSEENTSVSQLVVLIQAVIKVGACAPAAGIPTCSLLALGLLQHVLDVDELRAAALAACYAVMLNLLSIQ